MSTAVEGFVIPRRPLAADDRQGRIGSVISAAVAYTDRRDF